MLSARSRWMYTKISEPRINDLAKEAHISKLLAHILLSRGINTADEIQQLLTVNINTLHDPYLLTGMQRAVERIQRAIANGERIRIYGDYDADGVTSTALMIEVLRELKAQFNYYIPHRTQEGYGLHTAAIDDAKAQGCTLIITVDTGISAVEQIAYANQLQIDVIVTDHHEPPTQLPAAYVLVNPKLPHCTYPFKQLAGVGVAFKLAHALVGYIPVQWLELVAIGTIADVMPLVGENRIIVQQALQRMKHSTYPGIRALFHTSAIKPQQVTAMNIAFSLAPRINVSGRLAHANLAVQLLTSTEDESALCYAMELEKLNRKRQQLVATCVEEAEALLANKMEQTQELPAVIVLAAEKWNVGVIGIVAAKLLEKYHRPTFMFSVDAETGYCKGSARSIAAFDLYAALTTCASLFEDFGGHEFAAGMTIQHYRLSQLEVQLQQIAEQLVAEDFIPCVTVDAVCTLQDLSLEAIAQLELLAPFGVGNPSPRVMLRDVMVKEQRMIGKQSQHLKLTLAQAQLTLDAVAFQRSHLALRMTNDIQADVLGELSINEWNGQCKIQLILQDIRILQRQFFDYRGVEQPLTKATDLLHMLEQDEPQASAVLITSAQASGCTVIPFAWLYDGQGAIPYTEDCATTDMSVVMQQTAIRNLILCAFPSSETVWHNIMQQFPSVERMYVLLPRLSVTERLRLPDRARIVHAYRMLKAMGAWDDCPYTIETLCARSRMSERELRLLFAVLVELQIMTCTVNTTPISYAMVLQPPKTNLEQSEYYQDWLTASSWESDWYEKSATELAQWLMKFWAEAATDCHV